jgi:uncharacterized membrane protein YqjE
MSLATRTHLIPPMFLAPVCSFMKAGGGRVVVFLELESIVAHHAEVRVAARVAGPPSWLVGIVVGIAALSVVGHDIALFTLALFTSLSGIAFAAIGVFWIAAGVVAVIDPNHAVRNAAIVATVIVASVVLYLAAISSRPAPPGTSRGGPNVPLPPGVALPNSDQLR